MLSNLDYIEVCLIIGFALSGAFLTHYTHLLLKQSTVRSSAFWCLFVGCLFKYVDIDLSHTLSAHLPLIFATGTYLGMTQAKHLSSKRYLFIGSVMIALIYLFSENAFHGYGGKLGLIANFSILTVLGFHQLLPRIILKRH